MHCLHKSKRNTAYGSWCCVALLMLAARGIALSENQEESAYSSIDQDKCYTDDSDSWFLWKLVPLIARIRHGIQWDNRNQSIDLLNDPEFLYQTFYKYDVTYFIISLALLVLRYLNLKSVLTIITSFCVCACGE